ncbi:MAG: hypothetical protein ACOYN3_00410 [Acidimicrobiia bacterium]
MNTPPARIYVETENLETANGLVAVARYLNTFVSEKDGWALTGVGAASLAVTEKIPSDPLEIIASGTELIDASRRCQMSTSPRPDAALSAAQHGTRVAKISFDGTWVRDRVIPDRPKVARAYRFALAHARPLQIVFDAHANVPPVELRANQPFDAYIVALGQYMETRRGTPQRAAAADHAHALYQAVGAAHIAEQLRTLSSVCADVPILGEVDGVRRSDHETFALWHEQFLRERSARPIPSMTKRTRSALVRAGNWFSGRDFDQPDSVGR